MSYNKYFYQEVKYYRYFYRSQGYWHGRKHSQFFYRMPMNPDWVVGYVNGVVDRFLVDKGISVERSA